MTEQLLTSALLASVGGDEVGVITNLASAWDGARAAGPAFTIRAGPGDNLALHHALLQVTAGEVIVMTTGRCRECAHLGEIIARAAVYRGVTGIILDGAIRDRRDLADLRFPVFYNGTSPRKPQKAVAGETQVSISLLGTEVNPGDFVLADDDGVVVVPAAAREEIITAALELQVREAEITAAVGEGRSTVEIYGFGDPTFERGSSETHPER